MSEFPAKKERGNRWSINGNELTRKLVVWFQATEAPVQKCRRRSRNSTILVGRKRRDAKKWRTRKKWRPLAGTRGTARARACSPTNAPSPVAVLSVTNAPRAYPVPLATNDPRVATRGTRAAAVVSATKGDSRLSQLRLLMLSLAFLHPAGHLCFFPPLSSFLWYLRLLVYEPNITRSGSCLDGKAPGTMEKLLFSFLCFNFHAWYRILNFWLCIYAILAAILDTTEEF